MTESTGARRHAARPGCRPPQSLWDRLKFLVVLAVLIAWVTATKTNANPLEPVGVALASTLQSDWWLTVLVVLEVVRQVNVLALERSSSWNQAWEEAVVRPIQRLGHGRDDWTRYRIARAAKIIVLLALVSVVLAAHYHVSPLFALFVVPGMVMNSLPTIIEIGVYLLIGVGSFVAIFWYLSKGGYEVYFPGDVKTRFSDVWGQDAVLDRIKENLIFLTDPERIEEKGGYVPTGILLWGPPGTGKTLIAEAVAGETQVPFVFVEPGAFANMFIGVGILKVKSIFRRLRKLAVRYGGVVAFFDEADSLGSRGAIAGADGRFRFAGSPILGDAPTCHGGTYFDPATQQVLFEEELRRARASAPEPRAQGRSVWRYVVPGFGGMDGTLQALLTELSGLQKPRGFWNRVVRRALGLKPKEPPKYRILTILATNLPDVLDEALLRPGRIDRIYKVGYPSKEGRIRTFQGYLAKVHHALSDEDIDRLATMTPYLSGAAIKDMVNEALIIAIREGREVIEWPDMIRAKQIKTFGLPEDVEYVERERHAVAVHEACHAVTAVVVRRNSVIDIATIEKGSNFLGLVSYLPKEERFTRWRSEFEADIMVGLASLAGERAFFGGDNTSGVSGDLFSASRLAALMDTSWGMGDTILQLDAVRDLGIGGYGPQRRRVGPADDPRKGGIGDRVERRLEALYERVAQIVEEHRYDILAVAHALETQKTITGDDILAIMERRQGLLIDGTVYADPSMRAQIEAYHDAVARAHRLQESQPMTVPLPAGSALGAGTIADRREAAMRHRALTSEHDGDQS
ncbi:AAA ATPase central domain protein [Acidimicrobium ferrooxidans DSM 10331]|uniref:AAA ATPase central domain protein n=1 Tax=Acidimicrobium ferrooxidans (strain DSM 10331 / JCM 15462 / NBRC 103882 / ICP) TaxID=525909 RepID=C7M1B0_ACIFD|nr:AAA family ATPase [Acidimicrobium ferrooxidans]ACU54758.1 AAA ATPase central domain protein [Acidimicrobium ferrooxidans DSM 10331]